MHSVIAALPNANMLRLAGANALTIVPVALLLIAGELALTITDIR